ncbi:hypothetical protein [Plasmodium yoelii yoelii]|uniref:Uncharacterized protein n=1 Tax=Plasmodium yoelii yoelii TaxID=73239 RepID=Q7RRF5_PLAYO|nr:hypothetical protein [Plasmodium yoelii yoelii]
MRKKKYITDPFIYLHTNFLIVSIKLFIQKCYHSNRTSNDEFKIDNEGFFKIENISLFKNKINIMWKVLNKYVKSI